MQRETLGHYRVGKRLGAGAMGEVYEAEDSSLKRRVALKILPGEFASDPERLARFQTEAEAVAALNHPNIVTVHSLERASGPEGEVRFLSMELVEGQTLDRIISDSGLPLPEFFRLARQLLAGVAAAHTGGVTHRDLKPTNVMVAADGRVKILDFGLAKLRGPVSGSSSDSDLPTALLTEPGRVMGTPAYMAPEQAKGEAVDARADVFALGSVLYEMLTGRRAFEGDNAPTVLAAILTGEPRPPGELRSDLPAPLADLVLRCLSKDPAGRFASASEVLAALEALVPVPGAATELDSAGRWRRFLLPAAALGVALAVVASWLFVAGRRADRALEAVPEVLRLVDANRMREAAELALEVEKESGTNPALAPLWPRMSSPFRVSTDPPGARVFYRPYESGDEDWRPLGETPYENERFPVGAFRFRIEREGFETILAARSFVPASHLTEVARAGFDYLADPSYVIDVRMAPEDSLPEGMIPVAGGLYGTVPVLGFGPIQPRPIPEFTVDRTEVTNEAFGEFVAAGGYADPAHWREPFERGGEVIPWETAIASFLDATGRQGPATWVLGQPPDGGERLPVGGVSWFEASAYCRWRGKSLPTLYHWARAALPSSDPWIPFHPLLARASNFASDGPVPVASRDALGVSGAQDLGGNVREWSSTLSSAGRLLLGGGWNEPAYSLTDSAAASPWRRTEADGFRCVRYPEGEAPEHLNGPFRLVAQDFSGNPTVADAVFEARSQSHSYDHLQPLAVQSESSQELDWGIRRKISVAAPYGGRLPLRVHVPLGVEPPFQSVVYFPAGNTLRAREMEEFQLQFLVRSGRAVLEPVFDGSFERNDGRTLERWSSVASRRELISHWIQDLGRTLDYLEQDPDFDGEKVSFLGISLGASLVPNLVPFESRWRTGILYSGGFDPQEPQASIDDRAALARRIEIPILMLGGESDFTMPVELQAAMLRVLGTAEGDKHLRVYDAGHWPLPMNEVIRETVDFLDRYLGPVEPSTR